MNLANALRPKRNWGTVVGSWQVRSAMVWFRGRMPRKKETVCCAKSMRTITGRMGSTEIMIAKQFLNEEAKHRAMLLDMLEK